MNTSSTETRVESSDYARRLSLSLNLVPGMGASRSFASRHVSRRPGGWAAAFSSRDDSVVERRCVGRHVTTGPSKTTPRGDEATRGVKTRRSHRVFSGPAGLSLWRERASAGPFSLAKGV